MNFHDWIARIALMAPVLAISFTVHELSHAATAALLGDDTPGRQGRLSLNPIAHIDTLGFILCLIFGFGWAKPVEINPRNFRYLKTGTVLTAAAGPLSNFILCFISIVLLRTLPIAAWPLPVAKTIVLFLQTSAWTNVSLGVFNFLPLPPLDGGHLTMTLLHEYAPNTAYWIQRNSFFLILLLLLLPLDRWFSLSQAAHGIYTWIENLTHIF